MFRVGHRTLYNLLVRSKHKSLFHCLQNRLGMFHIASSREISLRFAYFQDYYRDKALAGEGKNARARIVLDSWGN
jgi:hypothetical protein